MVLALVAVVSLIPAPDIGGSDKLWHFITYAGLSAGFSLLVQRPGQLLLAALGLILYGVVLEYLQGLTGYRTMDSADMLANSTGVILGLPVWFTALPVWFRSIEGRFS